MAAMVLEQITTEMKHIASEGAKRIIEKRGKDIEYLGEQHFLFFERLFLEGLVQDMPAHLIAMYIEYLISYDSGFIERNASWDTIRRDINLSCARLICESDKYVTRIPCYCGVDSPHSFKTDEEYCENNILVYETVASAYVNGIHEIDDMKLLDTINSYRFARPPLYFKYVDLSSYDTRELVTDFSSPYIRGQFFSDNREDALDSIRYVYQRCDLIHPVWNKEPPYIKAPDVDMASQEPDTDQEPSAKKPKC
jgi:hypothetical protein